MATPFSKIYEKFIFKVKAYNISELVEKDRDDLLRIYLDAVCSKYIKEFKFDCCDIDEENQAFNADLNILEMDIIAEAMIVEWLSPIIYDFDVLQNNLYTRDFTEYSNSKILERLESVFDTCSKNVRLRIIEYTYKYGNLPEMTKNHKVVYQ